MGWRWWTTWSGLGFACLSACGRSDLDSAVWDEGVPPNGARAGQAHQGGASARAGAGSGGTAGSRALPMAGAPSSAGTPEAGVAGAPSEPLDFCSVDGWCWMNPLPQGNDLAAVLTLGEHSYFAGDVGMLFRYDGQAFERLQSPSDEDILALWGPSSQELWALTRDHVYRQREGVWEELLERERGFRHLHGTSGDDVWVAGEGLEHWDGVKWSALELPATWPSAIWAGAPGEVWVATSKALLRVANGEILPLEIGHFEALWGANGEVWAVGDTAVHCTADACEDLPLPPRVHQKITGSSEHDIWAIGATGSAHFDGESWRTDLPGTPTWSLHTLGLDAAGRPLIAGIAGSITRLEADSWHELSTGSRSGFGDIWGAAADDVWLVGGPTFHSDGQSLEQREVIDKWGVVGVHGTAADDVWLVGYHGKIAHFDGQASVDYSVEPWSDETDHLFSVFAANRSDVWTVGSWGMSYHYAGAAFEAAPGGQGSRAVHGLRSDYIFAVDHYGVLERFDGQRWKTVARAGALSSLLDVWVSPSGTAWVAGGYVGNWGELGRYDQNGWESFGEEDDVLEYQGIFGFSDKNVWAAGYRRLVHFDGERWSEEQTGAGGELTDVWGATPYDLWLIGRQGAVLRKKQER